MRALTVAHEWAPKRYRAGFQPSRVGLGWIPRAFHPNEQKPLVGDPDSPWAGIESRLRRLEGWRDPPVPLCVRLGHPTSQRLKPRCRRPVAPGKTPGLKPWAIESGPISEAKANAGILDMRCAQPRMTSLSGGGAIPRIAQMRAMHGARICGGFGRRQCGVARLSVTHLR